jgi:two-component system cell cycle sensor histidine kinase/response regulator CckA
MDLGDPPSEIEPEEFNRRLVAIMPGGVVHVGPTGAIQFANEEALRFLGLSYDEITRLYTSDFDLVTVWEDGTPCRAEDYPVSRALMTGQPQPRATIGVRRPDGDLWWAVFTAAPVVMGQPGSGVLVTFLDITERKRAEAARVESDARLRSILDSIPSVVISTNVDGIIVYVNRPAPGSMDRELLGRPAWDLVAESDQEKVKGALRRVSTTKTPESYETMAFSGTPYAVTVGPILVGDEVVGFTFIASNVARQRDLEARVVVADRMATIGTLAAGVAHEINNPLTYMLANLEWLRGETARSTTREKSLMHVDAALEGANRIRDVVRDLNSFSQVRRGRRVAVDVRELLDAAARMAEGEIRYRARVLRDYGDVPPVVTDESRLGQVFLNLIVNAAQAIPEGHANDREIRLRVFVEHEQMVVEISDAGEGIPPDLLPKIFDPFVTTKPQGVGTGLGLYISKNNVTSLGGDLSVTSEVGRGSTFRVTLPMVSPEARGVTPTAPIATERSEVSTSGPRIRAARPAKKSILLVDDEPHILHVLKTLLTGFDVQTSSSGREAMTMIMAHEFDVIICDLIMPDTTGMDVYEFVRDHRPGQEHNIVFMTGCAFTERARRFVESVPNVVLEKPFHVEQLRAAIEERRSP